MAEKTEKPTRKKLQTSRKKGLIGKSEDVPLLIMLAAAMEFLFIMAERGIDYLRNAFTTTLDLINTPFTSAMNYLTHALVSGLALFLLPLFAIIMVSRVCGNWLQFGIIFSPASISPKFDKLNPVTQFKQLFSMRKFTELITQLSKFSIIAYLCYLTLLPAIPDIVYLPNSTLITELHLFLYYIKLFFHRILALLIALAMIDFILQKYFFQKSQLMTIDEVRREHKDLEGDAHTKAYRKSVALALAQQAGEEVEQIQQLLDQSSIVLSNTLNAVVLLHYSQQEMSLPRIILKYDGKSTAAIISYAKNKNVPVIDAPRLVNVLMQCEQGDIIPRDTYEAVAKIFAQLQ